MRYIQVNLRYYFYLIYFINITVLFFYLMLSKIYHVSISLGISCLLYLEKGYIYNYFIIIYIIIF